MQLQQHLCMGAQLKRGIVELPHPLTPYPEFGEGEPELRLANSSRRSRPHWKIAGVVFLILFGLVGCQSAPTATPRPTLSPTPVPTLTTTSVPRPTLPPAINLNPADIETRVTLRMLNGTAKPLDVLLEGTIIASTVRFGVATEPVYVAAGTYKMRAVPGGTGLALNKILLEQAVTLKAGQSLVLAFYGNPDQPQVTTFTNNLAALPKDVTRVTLAHLVNNPAPLAVTESKTDGTANNKAFASLSQAIQPVELPDVPAGARTLAFRQDGGLSFQQSVLLESQRAYLIIVVGEPGLAQAVVIGENAAREINLRVINAILTDKPTVDVYLDSRLIADNLPYGEQSPALKLAGRASTLKLLKADDKPDAKPLFTTTIDSSETQNGSLVIFAVPNGYAAKLIAEDITPTPANQGRLIVLNAIPNVGDLQVARGGVLDNRINPILFRDSSPPTEMLAGPGDLAMQSGTATDPKAVEFKASFLIKAGYNYLYIAGARAQDERTPLVFATEVGILKKPVAVGTPDSQLQVRFINGLSDGSVVSLKVGERILFADVQAARSAAPINIPPQSAKVSLIDKNGKVLSSVELASAVNKSFLFVAVGTGSSARLVQQRSDNTPSTSIGIMQLINAGTGLDQIRATLGQGRTSASGGSSIDRATATALPNSNQTYEIAIQLGLGDLSAELALSAADYTVYIYSNKTNKLLGTLDIKVETGKRHDILLLPTADGKIAPLVFTFDDLPR